MIIQPPMIFEALLSAARTKVAAFLYDSWVIRNDSVNTVYFSLDGGNTYKTLFAGEGEIVDKGTRSDQLWMYASVGGSAVRVALWKQLDW